MTCQHPNCLHEVYENNKCIFHCEKEEWKYIDEEHRQISWNVPKVNDFFRKFQSLIDNNTSEEITFNDFIIPIYRYDTYTNSADEEDLGFILNYKNIVNCNIKFVSCNFIGYFHMKPTQNYIFTKSILFISCNFYQKIIIENIQIQSIIFAKSISDNEIEIKKSKIEKLLQIHFCDFNLFKITSSTIDSFNNYKSKPKICNMSIYDSTIINFTFKNIKLDTMSFISTKILNFHIEKIISTKLTMRSCTILDNGELYLNDVTSKHLEIQNLSQLKSKILLSELKVEKTFDLQYSNLYEASIKDIDLSNTQKVNLYNTSFLKTNFHYVTWGHTLDHIDAPRDTFRQLKRAYDEIGDHIEANKFYSMEMQKYREELKSDTKHRYDWQDKFLFTLNEYLSDFGRSWILPLLWIISLTALMILGIETFKSSSAQTPIAYVFVGRLVLSYLLIFFLLDALMDYKKHFQVLLYWTLSILAYYFYAVDAPFDCFARFISPSIDDAFRTYAFVWFIHKSLLGFLLYHFVTALRRQSKR